MELSSLRRYRPLERWLFPDGRLRILLVVALFASILLCGAIVYATGGIRFVYSHTMYVPIILAALFFKVPGGVIAAMVAGLVLGPLMPVDTTTAEMQTTANWVFRMVMFLLMGAVAGASFRLMHIHVTELKWLAYHNLETGLPNQAFLVSRLSDMMSTQCAVDGVGPAVMAFRLNNYASLVTTYGFSAMEPLAQQLTERVAGLLGAPVGQLLSSTYGVAVPVLPAPVEMDRLLDAMQQPLDVGGVPVLPHVTLGVAVCPRDGSAADDLIRRASLAATVARDRAVPAFEYSEPAEAERRQRLERLGLLPAALAEGQVAFHYQPVIDLKSGRTLLLEALLRWNHPVLGMVPPAEFIPLVETTSLVSPLHEYTMQRTFREFASLLAGGEALRLAVNLSVRLLRQPSWLDSAAALWHSHGLSPESLVFEVTESAVMSDPEAAVATLTHIRGMGIGLSIDDFGTGASACAYLKNLPVEHVKIDRAFVSDVLSSEHSQHIVRAMLGVIHGLGLKAVAEGVETEAQYRWLLRNGCDMGQGYWMCRPLPAEEIAHWLGQAHPGLPPVA